MNKDSGFVMYEKKWIQEFIDREILDEVSGTLNFLFMKMNPKANKLGKLIIGLGEIAQALGKSKRSVQRILQVLKEANFITTERTGTELIITFIDWIEPGERRPKNQKRRGSFTDKLGLNNE